MGSPEEGERYGDERYHRVCVEPFFLATTEVTNGQYRLFYSKNNSRDGFNEDDQPVAGLSLGQATAFAEWLSESTGKEYRLPTEAEWEYAARAGTETAYWWGEQVGTNRANCRVCGSRWDNMTTAPVGSFEPNPWGLYDTAGNVQEWTCSKYESRYDGSESRCEEDGDARWAVRGGGWDNAPNALRAAHRGHRSSDFSDGFLGDLGFRLARTP